MAATPDSTKTLEMLTRVSQRKIFRSATQLLWNKQESYASLYLLCRKREGLKDEERYILEQCEAKLELARSCLDRKVKRPFSFWELIHEVDGLLLLVIPEDMLPSRGLEILESFKSKIQNPIQRRLWLGSDKDEVSGPLPKIVEELTSKIFPTPGGPSVSATKSAQVRHTLRGALGVVNAQTDLGFWHLAMNVYIQILSGLLIVLLLVASIPVFAELKHVRENSSPELINEGLLWGEALIFGMFGLIGATLSNMLSEESFKGAIGATTRWFFYYLFVKPLIGGFAALFVFLVERSTMLLEIVIGAAPSSTNPATVQINVGNEVQAFLVRAALGLVAGFFADRVLSSTMERVLGRILVKSEKTLTRGPKPEEAGASPR